MSPQPRPDRARAFLDLHVPGTPLLLPNPWDAGSARLFEWIGFKALATTSSGHAATLGRLDGDITREEALAHGAEIAAATTLPVSADLENGFAHEPEGVAATAEGAVAAGLAGFSIEDYTGDDADPIYPIDLAVERVAAAVEAAHRNGAGVVVTARAENHLRGRDDLADTIARLQAYEAAGADVLYAPGPTNPDDIRAIVEAVGRPVNVLARGGSPSVSELAQLGVARISVGGAIAFAAIDAVVSAGRELLESGTYSYAEATSRGVAAARGAFGQPAA